MSISRSMLSLPRSSPETLIELHGATQHSGLTGPASFYKSAGSMRSETVVGAFAPSTRTITLMRA